MGDGGNSVCVCVCVGGGGEIGGNRGRGSLAARGPYGLKDVGWVGRGVMCLCVCVCVCVCGRGSTIKNRHLHHKYVSKTASANRIFGN